MEGDEVNVFVEASNDLSLCSLRISSTVYPGIFQAKKLGKMGFRSGMRNNILYYNILQYIVNNILYWFDLAIQYIVLVRSDNTIYCIGPT